MKLLTFVVCLCTLVTLSESVASYVKAICDRNPIHTTAEKSRGDHGFKITFDGTSEMDPKFTPGQVYTGKSNL